MADRILARPDDQTTIEQLVADLRPVKRLPSFALGLFTWLTVMGGVLAVSAQAPRPDLVSRATQIGFGTELIGLAAANVLLGALALRSARPDRAPRPREEALGWVLVLLAVGSVALQPTATGVALGEFVAIGSRCGWATLEFAGLPIFVLFGAIRRGAPVQPRSAATLAAGAGLGLAYLAMRVHCPLDDGAHLLVWHLLPVAAGTTLGAVFGARWLARWNRRSPT